VNESNLDRRLRRVEDTWAIQRLMARYGECVDNGYDLEGLAELLSEDLIWESNAFGEYRGRDAYLEGQARIGAGVAWAFHMMNPLRIDFDGEDRARGTFYLFMLGTFLGPDDGSEHPVVLTARYDNTFVKRDREWRCNRMQVRFNQVSRWTEGWVKERFWSG
jgi:hypothetical protein